MAFFSLPMTQEIILQNPDYQKQEDYIIHTCKATFFHHFHWRITCSDAAPVQRHQDLRHITKFGVILWHWSVLVRVRVETVVTQCFFTCISYETQIYNLQSKTWDIYNIDHSLKSLSTNLHFFLVPYQQSISFTAHKFNLQSTCFSLIWFAI